MVCEKKEKDRELRGYCAGPGGPDIGAGEGPGGAWVVDPDNAMPAARRLLNRKAKTPPIPAATAMAMNIAVRKPKLLEGW